MAADVPSDLPNAVLFACNLNRVRSPMAEAILKLAVGTDLYVDSCGLELPADAAEADTATLAADPFTQTVIAELGYDLSPHRAKTFDDLEDTSFDLVVALTPESHQRAIALARGRAADIEYWPILDPTVVEGSRDARLAAYRQVRDELARRISRRFGTPLPAPIDLAPPGAL
ncbi:MAG: low molecular weight phosphatase family protein [Phenylobacterium sp.]|jgi:protein-tyrosine-phosphatase